MFLCDKAFSVNNCSVTGVSDFKKAYQGTELSVDGRVFVRHVTVLQFCFLLISLFSL